MNMGEHAAEGFHGRIDPDRAMRRESHYLKGSNEFAAMRAMVHTVLTRWHAYSWTVQGFGFLRTYLPGDSKRFRLNVWHSRLAVPGVSVIHDHPWSFDSWIINGEFRNLRFVEDHWNGDEYDWMRIKSGETGFAHRETRSRIRLRTLPVEHYHTGDKYHQEADEIHLSGFDDGTVTLNDRTGDTEKPRVFWPAGQEWVDAKPRAATESEIAETTAVAIEKWQ